MRSARTRLLGYAGVVALVGTVLTARLVFLQILGNEAYAERAEGNRLRVVFQPAPRGIIRDRNGQILATSRLSYALTLYPLQDQRQSLEEVIPRLARILGMNEAEIRAKWKKSGLVARPVRIKQDLAPPTIALIAENQQHLPGVSIEPVTVRYYPRGRFASHLLGYTGEIADAELASFEEGSYRAGDIVGKTGIERIFDAQLRGVPGRQQIEVDARGKPMRILATVPPVPGQDLTLTLDANLQEVAEKLMQGSRGAAVALDPRTGEVLALASAPSFDPNWFAGRLAPEQWKQLMSPERPMLNRAISSVYPPGSIFKIVTHAAAMERGFANWNSRYNSTGAFTLGSRVFRDWKAGGFGHVDFKKALVMSIDTVYYELGLRMYQRWRAQGMKPEDEVLQRYARALGFGRPTGIILPSEASGLVPDAAWKREKRHEAWYPGESVNLSIGQGYLQVSPLQAAVMIATIANSGHVHRPRLVRGTLDAPKALEEREDLPLADPGVAPERWQSETWRMLHTALAEVVSGGTGVAAFIPGYPAAGKTGSAQSASGEKQKTHGWFVCYAPVGSPSIAIAVMKEQAGHGGSVAAPVAASLLRRHFGLPDPLMATVSATPSVAPGGPGD